MNEIENQKNETEAVTLANAGGHTDLTPRQIVEKLDQYIIGQKNAKRAVAVALRNRYRRIKLPEEIRDEVAPKNILMIGPTGVGKTEIARRLAKLCGAPFLKVEATKYTEVGYVGRDVESMIRDLMAVGFADVKSEMEEQLREKSKPIVEEKLLDLLLPGSAKKEKKSSGGGSVLGNIFGFSSKRNNSNPTSPASDAKSDEPKLIAPNNENGEKHSADESEIAIQVDELAKGLANAFAAAAVGGQNTENFSENNGEENTSSEPSEEDKTTREKFRQMLRDGKLEDREVELTIQPQMQMPNMEIIAGGSLDDLQDSLQGFATMLHGGGRSKRRSVTIREARRILTEETLDNMVDRDKVSEIAKKRVENSGIIFIDEIDKIATKNGEGRGQDVSREGVQRDILPIVEGSNVNTKFGVVNTTHILFIAAGAFSVSAPSDLIPELQGRFPLRVELDSLNASDFRRILTETKNALTVQYVALLGTEKVNLVFTDDAIDRMSHLAEEVNGKSENIGARRLHTIMEKVLDDISFDADEHAGETITIDAKYVDEKLGDLVKDQDLSRYIL